MATARQIDFQQELNAQQCETATAPDGPLLVLAAAGTGKTRTLIYRVAYLVERGVPPERILLLTFTNKAAREMLERAQELIGIEIGGMWGGTFHHMANRLLRRHGPLLGYDRDYTILDRDDSRTLVRSCIRDRGLASREFPKPEVLMAAFGAAVNTGRPARDVIAERLHGHEENSNHAVMIFKEYEERKRRQGAMDFDDLLAKALQLLEEHPDVLARYQEQFLHTLVDEYQDTNILQSRFVDLLAAGHGNMMVVGDDFQSIYSWRGADYRNIMTFPERYPQTRVFKLETNYRSVPEVLQVANECIAGNPRQFQKTLHAVREPYRKPSVVRVRDGDEQARFVAEKVRRLVHDGYKISDIAVLYRAHYHALELERHLVREGIPYVITSGRRFFEQAHVKDACSLLRLIQNPADAISFSRLLCLLPKVGERTAARLWTKLDGAFNPMDGHHCEALAAALPAAAKLVWAGIDGVFAECRDEDLRDDPGEIINRFVAAGYEQYAIDNFEDADRRLDDIRELALFTTNFDSLDSFLGEMALMTNMDVEADQPVSDHETLRLSTVHQAKGLEWAAVFVLWTSDGMFPSSRSLADAEDGEEEERRLFYVAVTRAKDELFFCVPEMRRSPDGGVFYCPQSRFIQELKPSSLRSIRPHVGY